MGLGRYARSMATFKITFSPQIQKQPAKVEAWDFSTKDGFVVFNDTPKGYSRQTAVASFAAAAVLSVEMQIED